MHADRRISGTLRAFSGPHPLTVAPATGPAGLDDGIDVTVTLSDGTTQERVACYDVPSF